MKCINKLFKTFTAILLASCLTACVSTGSALRMPFSDFANSSETKDFSESDAVLSGFASGLAVLEGDVTDYYELENAPAGLLVDLNNNEIIFAENAFEERFPASITKIMTAYVALKYCDPSETITCTENVSTIDVYGAVLMGLKKGDTLTLDQALHLALLASYNDVAVAIAEHVSGSVEAFAELMNEEAKLLGATHSNFENPHGLTGDNHYTTAYDLYLIFNAAIQNQTILEIIQCKEYATVYYDKNGKELSAYAQNTNRYFMGTYTIPETVTLVGGKTGTTDEAGYCLMMLVRDKYSNPYIAVILGSDSRDHLYNEMTELLSRLNN